MNLSKYMFFVIGVFVVLSGAVAGFIAPASFPKTAADLSFVDRMRLTASGYDQFESRYDADGNCVSGCTYAQPRIEDELASLERWGRITRQNLITEHGFTETPDGELVPPVVSNPNPSIQTPFPDEERPVVSNVPACENYNPRFAGRNVPYGNPLGHLACITSEFGARTLNGETSIHYGTDFRAAIGTPVYAPADGVVVRIFSGGDACGRGLVLEHADGYQTQYCHFSTVSVPSGKKITAGCMIGKTGNTGRSTGPHLHYSVIRHGHSVNPRDFIEPGHKMCH